MVTVQVTKATLRKEIHRRISALSADEKRIQSENVAKKLFELPIFQKSKRISVFLSTDNEVSTQPIVKKIFENGNSCFIPRYEGSLMEMVKLHSMEDWAQLPVTKWNIKQPHVSELRENALDGGGLDLIIVPGVAFTATGNRMGHGKGYYDIFLNRLQEIQLKPVTVALAFKEQILNEIPTDAHDVKIDYVLFCD